MLEDPLTEDQPEEWQLMLHGPNGAIIASELVWDDKRQAELAAEELTKALAPFNVPPEDDVWVEVIEV